MINILKKWEDRCKTLFEKAFEESEGHCKSGEPCITIGISNDGKYWCEIYSYLVDYTPEGGRHHLFNADTIEELIVKVEEAISKQERFLNEPG